MDDSIRANNINGAVSITKEDDAYIAKDLRTSVADQGDTPEEALNNLKEALELYYNNEDFSGADKKVEQYLETYDPRQPVEIGFSISDAYRYAESINKPISELTQEELSQFISKKAKDNNV